MWCVEKQKWKSRARCYRTRLPTAGSGSEASWNANENNFEYVDWLETLPKKQDPMEQVITERICTKGGLKAALEDVVRDSTAPTWQNKSPLYCSLAKIPAVKTDLNVVIG